jgi:hypothetical protein
MAIGMMLAWHLYKKKKREAEENQRIENIFVEEQLADFIILKLREDEEENKVPRTGRLYIHNDHDRARSNVYDDYFSPTYKFQDYQFERNFRITKAMAEIILLECGNSSRFFTNTTDALGKRSICPKVKLLMALKLLGFGSAAPVCIEYFQMGLSTARLCMLTMIKCIAESDALNGKFLRQMTRSDAKTVSTMHHEQHGIEGMIGSIDCMHMRWKNCPVAWHGQFQGKEKKATIVLEAMCECNLWFWHAAFGYAGSLNDINIWDQSPLLKSFIDKSFSGNVDFEFKINNQSFTKLFMLADGIYPEIARIAKTVDEPRGHGKKIYAKWQESCRKDIERAFGVIQRKFQVITRPSEQWFLSDINCIVKSCIILHNMMVEHRIKKGEREDSNFYDVHDDERINNIPIVFDAEADHVQQQN